MSDPESVPMPVGLRDVPITPEAARQMEQILADPNYPTHSGKETPTMTVDAVECTIADTTCLLRGRVEALEAKNASLRAAADHSAECDAQLMRDDGVPILPGISAVESCLRENGRLRADLTRLRSLAADVAYAHTQGRNAADMERSIRALNEGGERVSNLSAIARRIEAACSRSNPSDEPNRDRERIAVRYEELKRTLSFGESAAQARAEFIEEVLRETLAPVEAMVRSLSERVAAQSELLARKAEATL